MAQHHQVLGQLQAHLVHVQLVWIIRHNWPNSYIPQCTCSISHNAPSRPEMCTFLFSMVHYGIGNRCIVGFVRFIHWGSLVHFNKSPWNIIFVLCCCLISFYFSFHWIVYWKYKILWIFMLSKLQENSKTKLKCSYENWHCFACQHFIWPF